MCSRQVRVREAGKRRGHRGCHAAACQSDSSGGLLLLVSRHVRASTGGAEVYASPQGNVDCCRLLLCTKLSIVVHEDNNAHLMILRRRSGSSQGTKASMLRCVGPWLLCVGVPGAQVKLKF